LYRDLQPIYAKNFINRFHLVLQISKISSQIFFYRTSQHGLKKTSKEPLWRCPIAWGGRPSKYLQLAAAARGRSMAGPRRGQDLRRRRVTRPSLTCRSVHARTQHTPTPSPPAPSANPESHSRKLPVNPAPCTRGPLPAAAGAFSRRLRAAPPRHPRGARRARRARHAGPPRQRRSPPPAWNFAATATTPAKLRASEGGGGGSRVE